MPKKLPPKDKLEELLTYRLHLVKKLTDKLIHDEFVERIGLGLSEARVVLCIGSYGQLSVSELGQKSNLDRSQASRAADALVRRGLLVKSANEADARGVEIRLTEQGADLFKTALAVSQRRNAAFLALLAPEQAQSLMQALDTLIGALQVAQG